METVVLPKRKKIIELPEDVFRFLSIKASASGTNLKRYIELLCAKDVEDINDSVTYRHLLETKPGGSMKLNEEEQADFENWLEVKK